MLRELELFFRLLELFVFLFQLRVLSPLLLLEIVKQEFVCEWVCKWVNGCASV